MCYEVLLQSTLKTKLKERISSKAIQFVSLKWICYIHFNLLYTFQIKRQILEIVVCSFSNCLEKLDFKEI